MKYRFQYIPPIKDKPEFNWAMVIYHSRNDGPLCNSCNWMIRPFQDWDADNG